MTSYEVTGIWTNAEIKRYFLVVVLLPIECVEGSCFLELRETPLENQTSKFASLSVFVLRRLLDFQV